MRANIKNNTKSTKKFILVLIVFLIASGVYLFFYNYRKEKLPEEIRLNVSHISDQSESLKYSNNRIGGHCYLASTTMMLKNLDPTIEFWQVLIARGNSTGFSYYFPRGNESEIKESLGGGGTELALKAIRNLGYMPHLRFRGLPIIDKNNAWLKIAKELDGEVKTFWFMPPTDEYKSTIASGIPLVAAGSPCWQDYNVVEGYSADKLFVVVPNPEDQKQTDPKISCSTRMGLQNEVFWATALDKQIRHQEIIADMSLLAQSAPQQMDMYANYLEKGSSIVNFEIERLYLARLLTAKYLREREHNELALGYEKSANLLYSLTRFAPQDANKHKKEIIKIMREVSANEKSLLNRW